MGCEGMGEAGGVVPAGGGRKVAPVEALDAIEAVARVGRDQWAEAFAKHHSRLVDG